MKKEISDLNNFLTLANEVIVPINQCAENDVHPVLFKSNAVSVIVMPKSIK